MGYCKPFRLNGKRPGLAKGVASAGLRSTVTYSSGTNVIACQHGCVAVTVAACLNKTSLPSC